MKPPTTTIGPAELRQVALRLLEIAILAHDERSIEAEVELATLELEHDPAVVFAIASKLMYFVAGILVTYEHNHDHAVENLDMAMKALERDEKLRPDVAGHDAARALLGAAKIDSDGARILVGETYRDNGLHRMLSEIIKQSTQLIQVLTPGKRGKEALLQLRLDFLKAQVSDLKGHVGGETD